MLDADEPVVGAVQDQRGRADGRQHRPRIDLVAHAHQRHRRTRARPVPLVARPGRPRGGVVRHRRRKDAEQDAGAPAMPKLIDDALHLFGGRAEAMILGPRDAGKRSDDHQRRRPLGVRRREQQRRAGRPRTRRPVPRAMSRPHPSPPARRPCAARASARFTGTGSDMPVPRLSKRMTRAKQPGADSSAPVADRPRSGLDVRDESRNEDEVERPGADDLVRNVELPAPGVAGLGDVVHRFARSVVLNESACPPR